jgi:hypothetical protein
VIKIIIILKQNGVAKIVREYPEPTIIDPVMITEAPCLVWVVRAL